MRPIQGIYRHSRVDQKRLIKETYKRDLLKRPKKEHCKWDLPKGPIDTQELIQREL